MSLLDRAIQFRLDSETGPLVDTSLAHNQRSIIKTLEALADKYVGREVHVIYPAGYKPAP